MRRLFPLLLPLLLLACAPGAEPRAEAPAASPAPAPSAPAEGPLVLFLGDSLTAGYGLAQDQAYPVLAAAELAARGLPIRAVNAGVSGDTTAGGLARLDWLLRQKPAVVVVALGGNDGLRGLSLAEAEGNLRRIVTKIQAAGARPLLAGMLIPPNYGRDYATGFAALYHRLAGELAVPLIPFLLEGVAADPALNQADGIHPNAAGQAKVATTVARALEPLLR